MKEFTGSHEIRLINKKTIEATGIKEVKSFDESQIEFVSTAGNLQIGGTDLNIEKLSLETGEVLITGEIISIFYSGDETYQKKGMFSRLFG